MLAVGVLWSLYGFVIEPVQDRIQTLQRVIPEKQTELNEVRALSERYLALRRDVQDLRTRMAEQDSDFQLLPFLETLIEQRQLDPYVVTMEREMRSPQPGYSEILVEIGLEGITLPQLIGFLEAIDAADVVTHVGSLHIRKGTQGGMQLNATIQIQSPRLSPDAVVADTARP